MTKKKYPILNYFIPVVALFVVALHFIFSSTINLSAWKGGGFGMYADIHYYYNDIIISNLNPQFDSIIKQDKKVANYVMDLKRCPNSSSLKHMAELVSKYATSDTINVQIWKPKMDAEASSYSRVLINQYQFIKP